MTPHVPAVPSASVPDTPPASRTHVVVIPSFDTGSQVYKTVNAARARWQPVFVVVVGSHDGTG